MNVTWSKLGISLCRQAAKFVFWQMLKLNTWFIKQNFTFWELLAFVWNIKAITCTTVKTLIIVSNLMEEGNLIFVQLYPCASTPFCLVAQSKHHYFYTSASIKRDTNFLKKIFFVYYKFEVLLLCTMPYLN